MKIRLTVFAAMGLLSGCQVAGTAWLPLADDPQGIYRLSLQEPPPAELPAITTSAVRLLDGREVELWTGEGVWREDIQPGAYTIAEQYLLYVRVGDDVAGHAQSLIGMPVEPSAGGHERAQQAIYGQGYDPLSLFIHPWRLADQFPWPWVDHMGTFGGLANYLNRLSPDDGLDYDYGQGCYANSKGRPVVIGGDPASPAVHVVPGDVITAYAGEEIHLLAVLVRDAGRPGLLDPEDVVVSAQDPNAAASWQVQSWPLGSLMGEAPIHVFRRDHQRAVEHLERRQQADNPVWQMEPQRVWLLLAGVVLITLSLLRWGRRRRRGGKSSE